MRRKGALEAAAVLLAGEVSAAAKQGSIRLPPVRVLAVRAGCAYTTARKALRLLARQGLCTVVPGGGVFAGPRAGAAAATAAAGEPDRQSDGPQRRWQALAAKLKREVGALRYPPGRDLPTVKELCRDHGVCYKTAVTALRALVADGVLSVHLGRYRVYRHPSQSATATVVAVNAYREPFRLAMLTERAPDLWRTMERLRQQHNFRLKLVSIADVEKGGAAARTALGLDDGGRVLGYVVWTLGFSPDQVSRLAGLLDQSGKPVSLFTDSLAVSSMPPVATRSPRFRLFHAALSSACGRHMGQYLLSKGHRDLVVFADEPQKSYYLDRLQGLREVLGKAGRISAVPVAIPGPWTASADLAGYLGPAEGIRRTARRLLSNLAALTPGQENLRHAVVERRVREAVWSHAVTALNRDLLRRTLDRVPATAWVACNDLLAFTLMDFLRARRVDVPGRLSVVGFDDSPIAFLLDLTTYNFNFPAIAQAMVDHVLAGPRMRPATGAAGPSGTEIEGYVVERATSSQAAQATPAH